MEKEERKETRPLAELNPLKDESPIPYDKDKEERYDSYKEIVILMAEQNTIKKEMVPLILTIVREKLGLPSIRITSVSLSCYNHSLE